MEGLASEEIANTGVKHASVKILHLIIDSRFIDFAFSVFKEAEGVENRYVALVGTDVQHFNFIGHIPLWRMAGAEYSDSAQVIEDLGWCDVLVVHWWHSAAAQVVAKAPDSVIVVWSGWGGDYYNFLPGGDATLYGEKTKELLRRMRDAHKNQGTPKEKTLMTLRRIKASLKRALEKIKNRDVSDNKIIVKRVDYFSAPIPEDYDLLKAALGSQFRAEYVQLNYASVEKTFMRGESKVSGNDILLGNSATPTNNHLEILNLFSSIDLGERKVVVPLSYGSQAYGDEIEKCGHELLGNHFVPIRNLMPLEEYNSLIATCSIVIMNHCRQQALGNIGTMLYQGAKIFFDENSVVYKFFKRKGAFVFLVRDIALCGAEAFAPLSQSEKKRNIEVINQIWGRDIVHSNVRKFVDRMRQSKATRA